MQARPRLEVPVGAGAEAVQATRDGLPITHGSDPTPQRSLSVGVSIKKSRGPGGAYGQG